MAAKILEQNRTIFINSKINGKISKYAVKDDELSCDAKALYALLCTYGALKGIAQTGIKKLCKDLNISKKKLFSLLSELCFHGYIEIIKTRINGNYAKNNYKIAVCPDKYKNMPENDKDIYAYEKIRENGIQSYGYGIVEQCVLIDPDLHITAKAIYTYFCALAGNTGTAYPSVAAILRDLKICETTYYKHFKQLVEKKYVLVIEHKTQDGRYSPNEYKLIGHPNFSKPSNYDKNIVAVNENANKCTSKSVKNDNAPSPKSDTTDTNKNDPENRAEPSTIKPSATKPSTIKPYPINDTYNKNTIKKNNSKKNTLNPTEQKNLKKSKPDSNINQSQKIEKNKKNGLTELSEKQKNIIIKNLNQTKSINRSYLTNKAEIEFTINLLSQNVNNSKPKSQIDEFLIRRGLMAEPQKTEDNKLRRLIIKCLTDMLYDNGNESKKYSPADVAELVNTHIIVNNSVCSFDSWIEQFEKSFIQSISKPEISSKINNIYPYIKASLWKFLATYKDMYFDVRSRSETRDNLNIDDLFERAVRKSMNF